MVPDYSQTYTALYERETSSGGSSSGGSSSGGDANGNGIPDYLESWWMVDGQADTDTCHKHFPHFLIMMILLAMESLWLKDREERQDRKYNSLLNRLKNEENELN